MAAPKCGRMNGERHIFFFLFCTERCKSALNAEDVWRMYCTATLLPYALGASSRLVTFEYWAPQGKMCKYRDCSALRVCHHGWLIPSAPLLRLAPTYPTPTLRLSASSPLYNADLEKNPLCAISSESRVPEKFWKASVNGLGTTRS